ncbi:MAG: signal peptidase I [Candidatus Omnitrophota bacterium]|nr:MAG: signal peptidase I [Candidatus Omnitrophota bacterium]
MATTPKFLEVSRDFLEKGTHICFQAHGGSMHPFIKNGQIIHVKPTKISGINCGDIIFYLNEDGKLLIHRVIKKQKENGKMRLLTKGDSLSQFDGYVTAEKILGKVIGIEKKGRVIKIDRGLFKLINILYARASPFSKWIYFLPRKIKHAAINKKEKDICLEKLLLYYLVQVNENRLEASKIQEALHQDINWNYFFEYVRNQGVAHLVYKNLAEIDDVKLFIPEDIWQKFQSHYYTVAARNTSLCQKLNIILEAFAEAGVKVVLLKGVALIHTIYQNIALRPMYDIDVLIHKEDFSLVQAILKRLGYVNSTLYPEDFYKDNTMVDVHWELMNVTRVKSRSKSYHMNMDEVWRNSLPIQINGQKARVLSPEYCLMDLCLHLALHHGMQGLMWFIDIARLIEFYKNDIDWNMFTEKSQKYRIDKLIYYVLFYVKKNFSQNIPEFVLNRLRPSKLNFLERRIFSIISSGTSIENVRFFLALSTMPGLGGKLFFLKEIVFPSPKVLSTQYNFTPKTCISQYYAFHFKSIASSILKLLKKLS